MHQLKRKLVGGVTIHSYKSTGPIAADQPVRKHPFLAFLEGMLLTSNLGVATFFDGWARAGPKKPGTRCRDLFPIPPLQSWPEQVTTGHVALDDCTGVANMCLGALNCLSSGMKRLFQNKPMNTTPSTAQLSAQVHVCTRVVRFLERLDDMYDGTLPWEGSSKDCDKDAHVAQSIRAEAVDLPACAGTCEPVLEMDPELATSLSDPSFIFPNQGQLVLEKEGMNEERRLEYIKLTLRELRCGKLRLRKAVNGMGGVFAAAKSDNRQRKIWDGSRLSSMAARPPLPRRLANPSSFLDLEVRKDEELFFSKRDASTYFDVLRVPLPLQSWFGQPPVSINELLAAGGTFGEIEGFADEALSNTNAELFPVHVVWPMVFPGHQQWRKQTPWPFATQQALLRTAFFL